MGLKARKKDVDDLFKSLDSEATGSIDYNGLSRHLRMQGETLAPKAYDTAVAKPTRSIAKRDIRKTGGKTTEGSKPARQKPG